MPELEVLGRPSPTVTRGLMIGLIAVAGFLLLSRSGGGGGAAPPPSLGEEGEFLTAVAAARADLAGVQSSAEVQRISAASLAANTPAALRECWSAAEWNALPASVRRSIRAQARRSGTLFTAGNDGSFCLLPTAAGLAGELQPIQKIKRGYFGSSSRGIGASAPPAPEPTLIGLNRLALDYFAASQGGR